MKEALVDDGQYRSDQKIPGERLTQTLGSRRAGEAEELQVQHAPV